MRICLLKNIPNFAYLGEKDEARWGITPFSLTRDSSTLARANWQSILRETKKLPEAVRTGLAVERMTHWAVGWIEHLLVDTQNQDAVDAARQWWDAYEAYPVLDEDAYSALQSEVAQEIWRYAGGSERREYCREARIHHGSARAKHIPDAVYDYLDGYGYLN